MKETTSPDLIRFRGDASNIAFALRSRVMLPINAEDGQLLGYQIHTGPKRVPIIFYRDGDLEWNGSSPEILQRATIIELNHFRGTVKFSGTSMEGIPSSVEIRSTNPPY